jgi:hypothetical protein
MNKNLFGKITIFLIVSFFVMMSFSPAKELTDINDEIDLKGIHGEILDPSSYGPGIIEHMDVCIARDKQIRSEMDEYPSEGSSQHGIWVVPSIDVSSYPHSGNHNAINKWGDTMMGISFPAKIDLHGAWFAGQGGGKAAWASKIRVIGYCDGKITQKTDWFEDIDDTPSWFKINLIDVDRIVIEAAPTLNGGGWYGMDDLTYTYNEGSEKIVLDFDDCAFNKNLNEFNYAGLTWETGTGDFYVANNEISDSQILPIKDDNDFSDLGITSSPVTNYQGVIRGDAESWSYPPDSCGAVGPNHFVEVVNRNFAVYNKTTGEELINILLGSFLPESNGDPRVLYDQYSDRWFVIVADFQTKIFLAVSTTDDPTCEWFKCSFVVSQGSDAGKWPDYPTLGVDENGIYTAAYMVGGSSRMSIFGLDKAPLIAEDPSLGAIVAFRELPWEGAIQPVHTFGTTEGEYFVSRGSSTTLRLRLLTDLVKDPILTELGFVTIPSHSSPPDAPALGSTVPLDTVGHRLMNAVYRDGQIWTAHCINLNGRAASRWYNINTSGISLTDHGTISDLTMHYFFPSVMVNSVGDVIMGFSGSHADQYAAAYLTSRLAGDPPGEMNPPVLLKAGEDTYNLIDSYGRNRWGDYSLCSLDPIDEYTLWTVQEYAHAHDTDGTNRWGTWIGTIVTGNGNHPPEAPLIDGPTSGIAGVTYNYTFNSEDPDGDKLYYLVKWGDDSPGEWIGPYPSGEDITLSHAWDKPGEYEIMAKSMDNYSESNWSDTLIVNMLPLIELDYIRGGFFKVSAVIKNNGEEELIGIPCYITLYGGAIIGKESYVEVDIPVKGEVKIESNIILGLGQTMITVEAFAPGCKENIYKDGFIYIFYIHVKIGGK